MCWNASHFPMKINSKLALLLSQKFVREAREMTSNSTHYLEFISNNSLISRVFNSTGPGHECSKPSATSSETILCELIADMGPGSSSADPAEPGGTARPGEGVAARRKPERSGAGACRSESGEESMESFGSLFLGEKYEKSLKL